MCAFPSRKTQLVGRKSFFATSTTQGETYCGELRTFLLRSRVDASTTNLRRALTATSQNHPHIPSHRRLIFDERRKTHLWKTETQERGPEFHLATYFSQTGLMESRNGPINGILKVGPAMPFLFR